MVEEQTDPTYTPDARAWVEHVRTGGTRTWRAWRWSGAPVPGPTDSGPTDSGDTAVLPGAQQLELVRRLNQAGTPDPELVDRVLRTAAPGRGHPELDLVGAVPGKRHGRPPVEPTDLPAAELLRVATTVIADELVAGRWGDGELVAPAPRRSRPYRLAGDPWLMVHTREQLVGLGRPPRMPGRRRPVGIVLGRDLATMLADAWTFRTTYDEVPPWRTWIGLAQRRDVLPARADLALAAARLAERLEARRVHVVLDPEAQHAVLADLVGVRDRLPAPTRLGESGAELLRRLAAPLDLALAGDRARRRRLLRRVLAPRLAYAGAGSPPAVPAEHAAWVAHQALVLADRLVDGGYAVHGDPASLIAPAGHTTPGSSADDAVLEVAIRLLLEGGAE